MLLAHDVIQTAGDQEKNDVIGVDGLVDDRKTVFFLHGILGSRSNWKSFAKKLVDAAPKFRAVVVDLRNHGESHGFHAPHTVEACANDVAALIQDRAIVVGHSFGGKVALELARSRPELVDEVWSLDAPPGPRAFSGTGDVERVVAAVQSLSLPIKSRKALVDALIERGLSMPLAQWMTTNLRPIDDDTGFAWKFDLGAIPEMLQSFGALDLWPWLESYERRVPHVVLVRAGKGARYRDDEIERARRVEQRGFVEFRTLENAGHWLHTDNPDGLLSMFLEVTRA